MSMTNKIKSLVCCCCGQLTKGAQWHNRDKGYGICSRCVADEVRRGVTEESLHECYGIEGVNYNLESSK